MSKVNLDALIPREDFEIKDSQNQQVARNTVTLALVELSKESFFFSSLRKPDFQRETNEWDAKKIAGLIESFIEGDLIPAIIMWNNFRSYTFVIDGSHRLSALAAWVNDDYGDGSISKKFYDGIIPEEQLKIAEKTRLIIRKRIGPYSDYLLSIKDPTKVKSEIVERAKSIGRLALQLQWVDGDASKAEASFFKINRQASPINPTELLLLEARRKPNGLTARAIIRSGTGHKYWSKFALEKQEAIEKIAKEINAILFVPPLKTPIKTLDLPIAGKLYSSQTLPLVLNYVNIVNSLPLDKEKNIADDTDGNITLSHLDKCKRIAQRINSDNSRSLGLHPAVYFYSQDGRHKTASFYAITALMLEFENNKSIINNFITFREKFEEMLIEYDYLVQQIVRKYRSAIKAYPYVKKFYLEIIDKLTAPAKAKDAVISEIIQEPVFSYITKQVDNPEIPFPQKDFSREVKSATFMREAVSKALKCKICKGYIHQNSITVDHIKRKEDGGLGTVDNAQLAHPYCNTTVKN
jgi:hypothetical protein